MMEGEESDLYLDSVNKVVYWCDHNALVTNPLKTEEIIFGATQDTHIDPITVHKQPIKQTSAFKYPGLHVL